MIKKIADIPKHMVHEVMINVDGINTYTKSMILVTTTWRARSLRPRVAHSHT